MVKLLASHGAEVACKDKKSYTPLHAAASSGMISIVKYLLDLGVDVSSTYSIVLIVLTLLDLRRYYITIFNYSRFKLLIPTKRPSQVSICFDGGKLSRLKYLD